MNATEAFLGDPASWDRLRVELHAVHGLWGGHDCFVWGSGRVVARHASIPQHEVRYAAALPPVDVERLIAALIETDFITIAFPQRPRLPDEACPVVVIVNPAGERRRVAKWARDPHAGFDRVHALLERLAGQARQGECVYQGPYDPAFTPAEAA